MKIIVKAISKSYKKVKVLGIESLEINEGDVFGLVGNNGAGKTTLFRLILDLIKADEGEVHSGEYAVNQTELWKEYTGAYIDQSFLLDFLKPEEYFYFVGNLYGIEKKEVQSRLETFAALFSGEVLGQKKKLIRDLSAGNKQKVGIAAVFLIQPKVIILDEPFNALDPSSQIILKNMIRAYHQQHQAITIISSHDLNHIVDTCTRIAVMEKGAIIRSFDTSVDALKELNEYFVSGMMRKHEE